MDYADIRAGLIQHLQTEIAAVSNRVYGIYTASADTEKPFIELSFAGELIPASRNKCGVFQQVDVEVFGEPQDIYGIDPVADAVVDAMHEADITTPDGRSIHTKYVPSARFDDYNDKLKASFIRLKFIFGTDIWIN